MRDITELENVKAELATIAEAAELAKLKAELAKLKAELAESKRITREANAATKQARKQTAAMGLKTVQLEQLRPAILPAGPLRNDRPCSSAELSTYSRPWRRLLAMMRAPKHSLPRLTAEGLLRQLDVWYEDIGPKREWYGMASMFRELDKAEKPTKPSTDQAGTLESGTTTNTGAKVW